MNINATTKLGLIALAVAWGGASWAATAPGTSISNTATASFTIGATPASTTGSDTPITVDELLDVSATTVTTNVPVSSPDTAKATYYSVTNLGNGSETYDMSANLGLGSDDFDPTNAKIYIDDGDGVFEPGADDGSPVTSVALTAGQTQKIWLAVDIPSSLTDGNTGDVSLTATSQTGTGNAGTEVGSSAGDGGTHAIAGNSKGTATATADYIVQNISVTLSKSSTVTDPFGGSKPVPGATIRYTLTLTTSGSATAQSVIITDPIPTNTTYTASSITYDSASRTDGSDGDNCDYNVTNAGKVTCTVGDLTGATSHTVTFDVTID